MSEPMSPSVGMAVLHLFGHPAAEFDGQAVVAAVKNAQSRGVQVVSVSMLGHKADVAFMAVASDMRELRTFQTAIQTAGVFVSDSYVSITEVSEYAANVPEEMKNARLYPQLPPAGKNAWCFYPMSKRRDPENNWYTLPFDKRSELMAEHGKSGRAFAGRVIQLVTASAGFDDFEWGVTLFAVNPDDLKDVVYTMRFDEASAVYAEFGAFYVGMVTPVEELVASL
ncbi:MAG: chlorite dismutase [Actinobacteria bacterium]|jgi:hydrogen peroxide-dependent heme synthase|nr:chlorite dismutase [Actinomycetota bacterium]